MNGWSQIGNHERASDILRLMYDDYVKGNVNAKPDVMAYNTLLVANTKSKDPQAFARSLAIIEYMKKLSKDGVLDVEPDVYSMSNALGCLAHTKGDLLKAAMKGEEILNEMRESYNNGNTRMQPNHFCYNNVMDAWATKGRPEKAEALFLQMCKDVSAGNLAAKPDASTFNILLKAWSYSRKPHAPERSEQIIEQMESSSVVPNVATYTTLIACYGMSQQNGAPQKADKVLQRMHELHNSGRLKQGPSKRTYLSLRKTWELSNEPNKDQAIAAIDREIQNRFH